MGGGLEGATIPSILLGDNNFIIYKMASFHTKTFLKHDYLVRQLKIV